MCSGPDPFFSPTAEFQQFGGFQGWGYNLGLLVGVTGGPFKVGRQKGTIALLPWPE